VKVASSAFAGEIGVVRGGCEANSLRGSCKGIADCVRQTLEVVRKHVQLITDNVVMSWAGRSLQSTMSLEEEIVLIDGGDTTIDNCTRLWISVVICVGGLRGVESGMMPLATNNNSQLGAILTLDGVKLLERRSNLWNFVINDDSELALRRLHYMVQMKKISSADLRDAITINQDPLGKISVLGPVSLQTFLHHVSQVRDHLGEM
jgi:hypothetical protein